MFYKCTVLNMSECYNSEYKTEICIAASSAPNQFASCHWIKSLDIWQTFFYLLSLLLNGVILYWRKLDTDTLYI